MKKIVFSLLVILFLTGCNPYHGDFAQALEAQIADAQTRSVPVANHSHGYYSYYIQPKIGRISSERTSNIFALDGNSFVMNLNVAGIINARYYSNALDDATIRNEESLKVQINDTYQDGEDKTHPYTLSVYEINKQFFTIFHSDVVEFYSVGNELESLQVAKEMYNIARSVRVDKKEVISVFSNRQTISYTRKKLELFQNIVPESGAIQELFQNGKNYIGEDFSGDNYEEEIEVGERGDTLEGLDPSEENEEESSEEDIAETDE